MSKQPSNVSEQNESDKSLDAQQNTASEEVHQEAEAATEEQATKFQDLVDKSGISQATQGDAPKAAELDLAEENAKLKDQLLRAVAEAENTRRRAKQQVEDAAKFSISGFAKDLIDVLDNLYRASESFENITSEDPAIVSLKEGVDLTMGEFLKVCDRHGIVRVHPEGEPFDHNVHQAIANIPSADHAPGTVIQVMQSGYTLKDRLLRPAMVTVAKEAE